VIDWGNYVIVHRWFITITPVGPVSMNPAPVGTLATTRSLCLPKPTAILADAALPPGASNHRQRNGSATLTAGSRKTVFTHLLRIAPSSNNAT
jgi:hypothetical protein